MEIRPGLGGDRGVWYCRAEEVSVQVIEGETGLTTQIVRSNLIVITSSVFPCLTLIDEWAFLCGTGSPRFMAILFLVDILVNAKKD